MIPALRTAALQAALLILPAACGGPPRIDISVPPQELLSGLDPFGYRPVPLQERTVLLQTGPLRSVHRVTLSATGRPEEPLLHGIYSVPAEAFDPVPLVILLPALAGDHRITDFFVEYLNRRGIASLQPLPDADLFSLGQPLQVTRERLRRRVVRTRWFLDWIRTRPEIDPSRVGVMGVSLGALVASLVAASEDRLLCSVFILGGGDLDEILVRSSDRGVRRYRKSLMESAGWTETDLREEASRILAGVDPLRYADRLDPGRTLIVEALFDRVIPPASRREFWARSGRPSRVLLPAGHYSSLLLVPYVRWQTHRFLQTQFRTAPALAEAAEH